MSVYIEAKVKKSLLFASKYRELDITLFTTCRDEYLEVWNKASLSQYTYKFNSELWSWSNGEQLYLIKVTFLVNSKLPLVVVDRFLRIKLKVHSYTNNLRKNSGGCTKDILPEQFNRYEPTVIEIRPPKSLASIDIAQSRKLSLKGFKLPIKERSIEPTPPIQIDKPATAEDIAYSKLLNKNPLIGELVDKLNLVSLSTGEKLRAVETEPKEVKIEPKIEPPKVKLTGSQSERLKALTEQIVLPQSHYSKEDIVNKIIETTKATLERAEQGFNLILQNKYIKEALVGRYYLRTSTPF